MITREGNVIRVGLSPIEIEWIKAAVTLPLREREAAYIEIADMMGRKPSNVRFHAKHILAKHRKEVRAYLDLELRRQWHAGTGKSVMVPVGKSA